MSMISIKLVGEIFCGTSNRSNTSDTNDTFNAVNSSDASKTNTSVTQISSYFNIVKKMGGAQNRMV